jgi:hypothetical protein
VAALPAGGPAVNGIVNGTAMIRPGAGTGSIGGGSPKAAAGVISGATVRTRHP